MQCIYIEFKSGNMENKQLFDNVGIWLTHGVCRLTQHHTLAPPGGQFANIFTWQLDAQSVISCRTERETDRETEWYLAIVRCNIDARYKREK